SRVDRLYQLARREGAIGGKMPGAGGGGYFLLLTRFDRKHRVAAALERQGAQAVPLQFEPAGLRPWSAPHPGPPPPRPPWRARRALTCASRSSVPSIPGAAASRSIWGSSARR